MGATDPRAGRDRWLMSYADLMTLLLACFTTAFAASLPAGGAQRAPSASTAGDITLPQPELKEASPVADLSTFASLVETFGSQQVELWQDARGVVISLPESATFPIGSAELNEDAKPFLLRLAAALLDSDVEVRIEGHTDNAPLSGARFRSNWELSTARASAVVQFLVGTAGYPAPRLSAAGYGEYHPRVSNETAAGRALNRRVDVVVHHDDRQATLAGDPVAKVLALEPASAPEPQP